MQWSKQYKKEMRSHSRTDELLFELFPRHVAEALRDGRKVEPESREVVTIFFSDIVGFTTLSASMSAMKVSDMLDRLYLQFDALSKHHDIFKVETIGDAYLAVTNLVQDQQDHAKRIANFAIDAVHAARRTLIDEEDPHKGAVTIRVGFHSGPVVADVVGSRNPKYTLFGDTVNTASRMESHSMPNRIHCSEVTANLLREQDPQIHLQSRGHIAVKGKGQMLTYWVNEPPRKVLKRRTHFTPELNNTERKRSIHLNREEGETVAAPIAEPEPKPNVVLVEEEHTQNNMVEKQFGRAVRRTGSRYHNVAYDSIQEIDENAEEEKRLSLKLAGSSEEYRRPANHIDNESDSDDDDFAIANAIGSFSDPADNATDKHPPLPLTVS
mmetsp:Transcript_18241/g.27837  ORF Transcript_18241/g.27837 Transcript_18241/m.27837 type:complete len:382 (-) Transcript_18241:219-1364(-)